MSRVTVVAEPVEKPPSCVKKVPNVFLAVLPHVFKRLKSFFTGCEEAGKTPAIA